jgi:hypothetical protein
MRTISEETDEVLIADQLLTSYINSMGEVGTRVRKNSEEQLYQASAWAHGSTFKMQERERSRPALFLIGHGRFDFEPPTGMF